MAFATDPLGLAAPLYSFGKLTRMHKFRKCMKRAADAVVHDMDIHWNLPPPRQDDQDVKDFILKLIDIRTQVYDSGGLLKPPGGVVEAVVEDVVTEADRVRFMKDAFEFFHMPLCPSVSMKLTHFCKDRHCCKNIKHCKARLGLSG
jgi:hypothetical protein